MVSFVCAEIHLHSISIMLWTLPPRIGSVSLDTCIKPIFKGHSKRNEPEALKKEWFRQERGSSLPAARGSRVHVTWLKANTLAEIQVGGHPLYSPDLSPCDYAIFGPLKKALRGKRFTSDDYAKQYVRNWFTTHPREFYETAIHRLVSQWDKCLNSQGQYFWHTGTSFCS